MARKNRRPLDPDGVVPWLASTFKGSGWRGLIAGVGDDDCGVIQVGKSIVVVSADFLNATPIAEQLGLGRERVLGRIAVAATLADLLGSGAVPRALLVGITVPHGYPEVLFKDLMQGVRMESEQWRVPVIAGDTKLGVTRAILTCGFGTVASRRQLFLSSNARPGDVIFASGNLGTCAAATCLAERRKPLPRWALRAITTPQLPMHRSRGLSALQVANGGIDVSDGLAADLRRMCEASGAGAILEADRIPLDSHVPAVAKQERVSPWAFALASGGDFQFIVTVPRSASVAAEQLGFTRIGVVTRERRFLLTDEGGRCRWRLPESGHRDRQGQQFVDEIRGIIRQVESGRKKA
jgi:thiamine-monophosphate kinase